MASKNFSLTGEAKATQTLSCLSSNPQPPISTDSHRNDESAANPCVNPSCDKTCLHSTLDRTVSHFIEYNRHLMETNESLTKKIEKLEISLENASLREKQLTSLYLNSQLNPIMNLFGAPTVQIPTTTTSSDSAGFLFGTTSSATPQQSFKFGVPDFTSSNQLSKVTTDSIYNNFITSRPSEIITTSTGSSGLTFSESFSKPSFSFGNASSSSSTLTKSTFLTNLTDSLQKPTNETNESVHLKTTPEAPLQSNEDSEDSSILHDDGDHIYFKPVLEKLPEKVEIVTGEENDQVIFSERAKLFRWVQSEWKERGLGDMKLLQNKDTGIVRAVMRREHIHKVCCNHCVSSGMQLNPMPGSSAGKSWTWFALDFADSLETPESTTFAIRFKDVQQAEKFQNEFNKAVESHSSPVKDSQNKKVKKEKSSDDEVVLLSVDAPFVTEEQKVRAKNLMLRETHFSYENVPGYMANEDSDETTPKENHEKRLEEIKENKSPLSSAVANSSGESVGQAQPKECGVNETVTPIFGSSFQTNKGGPLTFGDFIKSSPGSKSALVQPFSWGGTSKHDDENVENDPAYDPHYEPIVNLPEIEEHTTGEEDDECLFQQRAKLYRFSNAQWKERGIGTMKVLMRTLDKKITARLVMRRDQIKKLCCNQQIMLNCPDFTPFTSSANAVCWLAIDHSEGTPSTEKLAVKFREEKDYKAFVSAVSDIQKKLKENSQD